MNKHFDVQIIGAGLSGLSLATILGKNNINTIIIDNLRPPNENITKDNRTSALTEYSVNLMQNIDAFNISELNAYEIQTIKIFAVNNNYKILSNVNFNSYDINKKYLALNINNNSLRKKLCNIIDNLPTVTHIYNTNVTKAKYINDYVYIKTDKNTFSANLTIATDGKNSNIRKIFDFNTNVKNYNQKAIVFNIKHSEKNNNISNEFMYPQGTFTTVPINDYESSIIWIENSQITQKIIESKQLLLNILNKKTQGILGNIYINSKIQTFNIDKIIAKQITKKRLCLIGETAHSLTPVAAQGLNLSLRDCAIIAELIVTQSHKNLDIGSDKLLKKYNELRKIDIISRDIATDIFHNMSQKYDPFNLILKKISMNLINKIPMINKSIMKLGLYFPNKVPIYMKKKN